MSSRLLITGASGILGDYLLEEARRRGQAVVAWSGASQGDRYGVTLIPVDLADPQAIQTAFLTAQPQRIIHVAAMASVADCYRQPERARQINTQATAQLACLAAACQARLVFVSTDLVFDGRAAPYRETDVPQPLSVYGATKAAAESAVLAHPGHVVARVSLLYGPSRIGRPAFFDQQLVALRSGQPLSLFADEWRTPLDLPTAARGLLELVESDLTGVIHLGGPERMSRLEMGQRLAAVLGCSDVALRPARRDDVPGEPRPRDVSLDSTRWRANFPHLPWPTFEQAVGSLLTR